MAVTPKNPKPDRDDPEQSKRFEDAAREMGADESGKKFRRAFKTVVPIKHAPKRRGS